MVSATLQGKHQAAALVFAHAVTALSSASVQADGEPSIRQALLGSKYGSILYNAGVQHLTCGSWVCAFDAFAAASVEMSQRPSVWIRLAECCIAHCQSAGEGVGTMPCSVLVCGH